MVVALHNQPSYFGPCPLISIFTFALKLFSIATAFTLLVFSVAATPPEPRVSRHLHHVNRKELVARAMHPDLFRRANVVPTGNPGPGPCNTFSSPSRRDEYATTTEQLLDAREMAAFLLGRGSFTASNGTTYEDHDYALALKRETSESHVRLYRRAYNVVRDTLGNKLLEISVPHYRRWKSSLDPIEIVYLSPKTAIRACDINQLEHILISNPDFVDIQVRRFRISKTFIEVARSY